MTRGGTSIANTVSSTGHDSEPRIHHVAIVQTSKDVSKRWFVDVLEATVENEFVLDLRLADQVFGLSGEVVEVLHYRVGDSFVEVFIRPTGESRHISHVGFWCQSHERIVRACERHGFDYILASRPEFPDLLFAFDGDGNRFEFHQAT